MQSVASVTPQADPAALSLGDIVLSDDLVFARLVELLGADLERHHMRLVSRCVRSAVDGTVRTVDMAFEAAMHLGTALTLWPGLSTLTVSSRREALLVLSAAPLGRMLTLTVRYEVRACISMQRRTRMHRAPSNAPAWSGRRTRHPACLAHNPTQGTCSSHVCCHSRPRNQLTRWLRACPSRAAALWGVEGAYPQPHGSAGAP
jgi:hypothetical protein